jgi:hypothetical protein
LEQGATICPETGLVVVTLNAVFLGSSIGSASRETEAPKVAISDNAR